MADLTPVQQWVGVYQLETTDIVQGGVGGKANEPHQDILDRTQYIYDTFYEAGTPLTTPVDIQIAGSTDPNLIYASATYNAIGFGISPTNSTYKILVAGDAYVYANAPAFVLDEADTSGSGSLWRLVLDGNNLRFGASTNGTDFTTTLVPITMEGTSGQVVINNGSNANIDLLCKGVGNASLFHVDAGVDSIGMGMVANTNVTTTVHQKTTNGDNLRLAGDFATPSTGGGEMIIADKNDADAFAIGVGAGDEFRIFDGSTNIAMSIDANYKTIFNVSNLTGADFQVKGLTDDNLIYVDASQDNIGIGAAPASNRKVQITYSNASGYTLQSINSATTGAATAGLFQSSSTDAVTLLGDATHATGNAIGVKGKTVSSSTSSYGVYGESASGISVGGNTAYNTASDKFIKINKHEIEILSILRDSKIDVKKWNYEDSNYSGFNEFVGPTAQDIKFAFDLTFEDDIIYSVDGIALGGVIELMHELDKLKEEVRLLKENK
jgi:hypothetical protein